MTGPERRLATMIGIVAYVAVATFLCLAAIANPDLNDTEQYVWCAVAVAWGPIVLFALALFGFLG